ncbi:MAG: DUF1365 domain-containing protein [Caulobacteraceae bacterium]
MSEEASALYFGSVVHQRFTPRRHRLNYSMFQALIDLDQAPALGRRLRLFSHNRLNVFSFHDRDHGAGEGRLRPWVEATAAKAGVDLAGGKILLLCMPRMFGHVFNPLSIYFCHAADGTLAAMIYEVNNTFGERHSYVMPAPASIRGVIRQTCAKALHVSPFMAMEMTYDFLIAPPGPAISTTVHGADAGGARVITAIFRGRRHPFSDGMLMRALVAFPLLTLKVVLAIHWEAVRLLVKGVRLRPRPPSPTGPITACPMAWADSTAPVENR